jgi:hypothetical protein
MKLLHASCSACGAPLALSSVTAITCAFCGSVYLQPTNFARRAPETKVDIGDLILGARFDDSQTPGFLQYNEEHVQFGADQGGIPELLAEFSKEDSYFSVIGTPGPFDQMDVSVTIRFLKGSFSDVRAGIEFCYTDDGNYLAAISPQGTFCLGYHNQRTWGDYLSNWNEHPSLKQGWESSNRLRIIHQGNRIRLYLNGILAASVRDERYPGGRIILACGPIGGDASFAFQDLQIREVLDHA